MPYDLTVHGIKESCKGDHSAYMGRLHGKMRGDSADGRNEGPLFKAKGNYRKVIWNGKRSTWIQIYANDRKGSNEHESRANICVYESKETGKDKAKNGTDRIWALLIFSNSSRCISTNRIKTKR